MSPIQFAAAAIISYLGLLAGFFLGSATTEELTTATKYFPMLQRAIILAIAVVIANYFGLALALMLLICAVVIVLTLLGMNTRLFYAVFGLALLAVAQSVNFLLITAALIFIFGIVSGSEYFATTMKRKSQIMVAAGKLLLQNLAYPAIAVIFFLLPFHFG